MKFSYMMYDPVPDLAELSRRMETVAALGYQGIELVATHPMGYDVGELAEASRKVGLPVVSFLSGWSYAAEGLCLSSPDASIRDRAAGRIIGYVRQAAGLGALVVVGLMQGLRSDEPDEDVANDRIAEGLVRVAGAAEVGGVTVAIEPVNHLQVGFNHTAEAASKLAARVGSPALGYMLDTLHMNIEERSVVNGLREYGTAARHVHLCETNGGPFGSGGLDFGEVLAALGGAGYDRFVSVKVYRHLAWDSAARESASFLRNLGARLN
jgi:D-psicose/D-tagatose/L-ribulose 3-epimerase